MAVSLNLSSEFATFVKELQKKPDDPLLKKEVYSRLPEMKVLAKNNPIDLFRLAQIYSPTSPQFKKMMSESAAKGCTNAMLSLSELLLQSGSPSDVKTAAHYIKMIERSKDSYLIKHSRQLVSTYPELAVEMRGSVKSVPYNPKLRFFSSQQESRHENRNENPNTFTV